MTTRSKIFEPRWSLLAIALIVAVSAPLGYGNTNTHIPVGFVGPSTVEEAMGLPYNSKLERLVSRVPCLNPLGESDVQIVSDSSSQVQLYNVKSVSGLTNEFSLGSSLSVPIMEIFPNLTANLLRSKTDSTVAVTWLAQSTSTIGRVRASLTNLTLAEDFDEVSFHSLCGDRFVNEITYGSSLLVSIQLKIRSQEDKRKFELALGAKFGANDAKGAFNWLKGNTSFSGTLEIKGEQVGGKAEGLAAILGAGFVRCDLSTLDSCVAFDATMKYLTTDFAAQFRELNHNTITDRIENGVPIRYDTKAYRQVAKIVREHPFIRGLSPQDDLEDRKQASRTSEIKRMRDNMVKEVDVLQDAFYGPGIVYVGIYSQTLDAYVSRMLESVESLDSAVNQCSGLALDDDFGDCELLYSNASALYFETKERWKNFDRTYYPDQVDLIQGCLVFAHPWPEAVKNVEVYLKDWSGRPITFSDSRTHAINPKDGSVCYLFQGQRAEPVSQISSIEFYYKTIGDSGDVSTSSPYDPAKFTATVIRTGETYSSGRRQ